MPLGELPVVGVPPPPLTGAVDTVVVGTGPGGGGSGAEPSTTSNVEPVSSWSPIVWETTTS